MILLLFFCSGATALIYEVLWSKYLTMLFGSTVQAQTVVLAVFMGGLALGNRLFGKLADRAAQPLALYGYLEAAVGLWGFFFSAIYGVADRVFAALGSNLLEHSAWLLLLKGAMSAVLLLGPTVLMGGTLPLLAAWLQRGTPDAGRCSARFYSTNSLGAVLGAGLAGFFLVTWLGLPTTVQMTGLVNVLIGITALAIARYQKTELETGNRSVETTGGTGQGSAARSFRWGCLLVALTGAVSMGLEVVASRCLCLIFGATLQAFAVVLMGFILGIGLGSAVIASPRRKQWPKDVTIIVLILGAAGWIGMLVYGIEGLVDLYRFARSGLSSSTVGFGYYQVMTGLFSMLVLGVPAAALGSVLPLLIREASDGASFLGERVGRLLTWNTVGAVVGVLLTGFVLMPGIGLRGSFAALALVLAGVALLVAWTTGRRVAFAGAVCVAGFLTIVTATGGANWRVVLSSGVFRLREKEYAAGLMESRLKTEHLLFYEDAADATVSVEGTNTARSLRVNGKPDASTHVDLLTQRLIAHLPLMARPDSQDVFMFGLGSGITANSALGHPIRHLTIAENCRPVLRAAEFFERWNHGAMTNARTHIIPEDARTVLKLTRQQFDVIIAEPSNPWTVGVGSVFSREFYNMAAQRLKPGGIMVQWFHVYEVSDNIVDLVIRTFASVFPVIEIWDTSGGDIVLLGSQQHWQSDRAVCERLFTREGPRSELVEMGITTPEALLARQFASQRTAFAVVGPGPLQTDDYPILEYAAPRAFFIGSSASRFRIFDERTWQAGIAPAEKVAQLASLDETRLKAAFGKFPSVNRDVNYQLKRLDSSGIELIGGGLGTPWAFAGIHGSSLKPPPTAATNDVAQRLFESELMLLSEPAKRPQAVAQIQQILDNATAYRPDGGWSATYYVNLAAQTSLALRDAPRAKRLLLRGLQLEPDSDGMKYLARIMAREGVVLPQELPQGTLF